MNVEDMACGIRGRAGLKEGLCRKECDRLKTGGVQEPSQISVCGINSRGRIGARGGKIDHRDRARAARSGD